MCEFENGWAAGRREVTRADIASDTQRPSGHSMHSSRWSTGHFGAPEIGIDQAPPGWFPAVGGGAREAEISPFNMPSPAILPNFACHTVTFILCLGESPLFDPSQKTRAATHFAILSVWLWHCDG
jgi:hypothetical protein